MEKIQEGEIERGREIVQGERKRDRNREIYHYHRERCSQWKEYMVKIQERDICECINT